MKRAVVAIFLLSTLLLAGCRTAEDELIAPVEFYYCTDLDSTSDFENIITAELRESAGLEENLPILLNLYLSGPTSGDLISPYPAGLQLISVSKSDTGLKLILSDEIAQLSGLDLILACTCLSKTAFALGPCEQVTISAETALIDEQTTLMIRKDELIFIDDSYPAMTD